MARYKLFKIKTFDAHGGLSPDYLNNHQSLKNDGYSSTRAGRYVVHSIDKHVSAKRWLWSTVAWGTPVKIENKVVHIMQSGRWTKLTSLNAEWRAFTEKEVYDNLMDLYTKYYLPYYGKSEPDKWIFNDFGHVSIKYFKDTNNNQRLDKSEQLMSDFMHTTPIDEGVTFYNKQSPAVAKSVVLQPSHGCIHVKPADVDIMINSGFIEKGGTIEVHPYSNPLLIQNIIETDLANPKKSFEVHFYPLSNNKNSAVSGSGKLVVYSINKIK